ncbi:MULTISPECIES: 3-hydroxyacyl-CoA dehydrogenase NAD-binding domain-containing protein [unclassified Streptomyces]|uniref:3-hydroxyacyl-CoA dehydrogenase family protein n=1 Tax=unclassified Streptomyces TaxID=2593676 RepID=UPI002E8042A0|nr:3-hydroxyacyl-CoA dehydrogenase NAD-binding domain-containing protein [Streptomyces sp. NBC_00589]WTI34998.1 3-hydroxyacyl-CoA dehydrogenase NAD-binding domain-containing protein [Streptomyces sp. NBC_00775]WUB31328.1 3-hydroxyacyl-CoA dehydrogenase NAD-binding domain-containing protein [Streptomyces sp. NBC_00589]
MSARHGTVGVVGLGTIGGALARRAATAGHTVLVLDSDKGAGERLRQLLDETPEARGRIRLVDHWEELASAATVLEAVPERRDTKVAVLRALDRACPPETVLASSAAALSLTDLAAASGRPGRLVGLHLALPTAGLAEIGRTVMTDESALTQVRDLADGIGLSRVTVGDRAGLISTSLLFGFLNQAVTMYDQRLAGRDDIDAAMRHGCGLPLGPLELLDLIGTDTACDILDVLAARWSEPTLQPARRLRHMALAGLLGRKSGRGFYDYREPAGAPPAPERPSPAEAPIRTVGIVGTGTMATGIAEVFAKGGVATVLVGRTDERAKAAWEAVATSTARAVRRGKLAEAEREAALERLTPSGVLAQLADCDLVIEAIAEDLDVKKELFRTLGELCRPGALLATTTSSLPVIECGLASGRPEDVIGLHFFNPAPLMRLVEVIPSLETAPQHINVARELCHRLGKHPVRCMDRPGFIVNALLFPYLNGAVRLTESHYATPDEIDDVMKLGCGYPLGPFELLDIIGLDISLSIQRVLHDADRHPRSVPAPLLGHLVAAGRAGRKSGAGFRVYG